jgi:hypothetical protein
MVAGGTRREERAGVTTVRWEYLVADDRATNYRRPVDVMNELGAEGWELVSARSTSNPAVVEYIFKRPNEKDRGMTEAELMEILRDPVRREEFFKKVEGRLLRGLDRQEPWAICLFKEGMRLVNDCLTIDADGRIVYRLDSYEDNIVPLKMESKE